ncbi:HEAT repeat domain-containing protein [Leptothoe spongobia]|uniref:HEAT repeat domain-containing protein n=1 Tax=Leptothoe spongobia TAU-MAC 1115 TaxID=1967444 RepID=A0A947GKD6_9CYAN|nr:HEAT repeat domain-containing protein [Leptothoe spongobia]MBT9316287.1 HEAT repeat domain-containing protein [Leptothoe spongobia TAU-MAC 1115]
MKVNFECYLRSLVTTYKQWWKLYALTDAVGQVRQTEKGQVISSPFDFGLMVQTVQQEGELAGSDVNSCQEKRESTELLPVLDGIRKYANDHVLLVGRPGSGKSTALLRLVLEEASRVQQRSDDSEPIPVLVELRFWNTSVLSRILAFFKRHDPALEMDESTLPSLLRQGRILVLMDGLNELPSTAAKQDVLRFQTDYPQAPMIFTTRDLSIGGDFGLTKKLEMQPLSDTQMRQFVMAYLPNQGEQLLHQLKGRMRSFAETPLLLWMLCSLFQQMGKLPSNLGMVFRQFTQGYERNLKQDVPVSKESRRWWSELMQYLAFVMIEGKPEANPPHPLSPPSALVSIPCNEARSIFERFFQGKVTDPGDRAAECLDDLLEHHLIQETGDQLEFRHQLIQEYYAAEYVLQLLDRKEISNTELQKKYLNYQKWTEPFSVLIALLEHSNDKARAINIIELAQAVDLILMAKLAGSAPPTIQEQTIQVINQLQVTDWFKTELLTKVYPESAVESLAQSLESELFEIRRQAAHILERLSSRAAIEVLAKASQHPVSYVQRTANESLERIKQTRPREFQSFQNSKENSSEFSENASTFLDVSQASTPGLLKALEDANTDVRWCAAEALGQIGSEAAIPGLLKALEDSDTDVRWCAAEALGQIGSEAAIPGLLKALEDSDTSVCRRAAEALGQIGSEAAIPGLLKALEDANNDVRWRATEALGQIGSEAAIPGLLKALEDSDTDVRWWAAEALGQIGSEAAIPGLPKALEHSDTDVRRRAGEALGQIGSEAAIPGLLKALEHSDTDVRWCAAEALGQISSEAAIPGLLKALEHSDTDVRRRSAEALGQIGSEAAIPGLLKALEDSDTDVRWWAAEALGQIGSEAAIPGLPKALEHSDTDVRRRAGEALGQIGSEAAIPGLLKALEHSDTDVRWCAAEALGQISSEAAIPGLLKALEHSDTDVRRRSAEALGQIGSEAAIPGLLKALEDSDTDVCRRAAQALVKIGSEAAIPGLLKALEDSDTDVRRRAAQALGQIGDSEAVIPGLLKALEHSDNDVRWSAAEALKTSGTPSTLFFLYQRQFIADDNFAPIIEAIQDRFQFYNYEIASGFVQSDKAILLYFSYASKDKDLKDKLIDHLSFLQREGVIINWDNRQILPGDESAKIINQHLNIANIILLLISANSLADDTCSLEIKRAMERHQAGKACVIPILLRPVDWAGAPFSQLDVLPKKHQPITTWANQDEAFREITAGIREVVMEMRRE